MPPDMLDTHSPFVLDWRNALGLVLSVLVAFISGPGVLAVLCSSVLCVLLFEENQFSCLD